MAKHLPLKTKFFYGIGNLGYGTIAQTVNNFIMFFGTSVLGVKGTYIGLVMAIAAFWDGISDPLVGYWSDHTHSRTFGRRLGFLLFASIGMALFNIFLWIVPMQASEWVKVVWLLVCLLMLESFNTAFATPYVALGIDIAPDYNEQSTVQGFKTVFFILGMILPSLLMLIFMPSSSGAQSQLSQSGYVNMSYFTSCLALVTGIICILGCIKASRKFDVKTIPKKEKRAFFKIFYTFFKTIKKDNYGVIIIGYSVSLLSSAFLTSVGLHLFTYSFHFSSFKISVLMSLIFVGAIISQPIWVFLSKRINKKETLLTALFTTLIGIGFTTILFLFRQMLSNNLLFAICVPCIFLCGFGTGALYSMPVSMFADVVTLEKLKSGENNSATYSGFMTLAYNIANSLALLFIGIMLDLIKFNSQQPVQPLSVQNWLGGIVFGGCALSVGISMAIFSRYKLTRSEILKAQIKAGEDSKR